MQTFLSRIFCEAKTNHKVVAGIGVEFTLLPNIVGSSFSEWLGIIFY